MMISNTNIKSEEILYFPNYVYGTKEGQMADQNILIPCHLGQLVEFQREWKSQTKYEIEYILKRIILEGPKTAKIPINVGMLIGIIVGILSIIILGFIIFYCRRRSKKNRHHDNPNRSSGQASYKRKSEDQNHSSDNFMDKAEPVVLAPPSVGQKKNQ